MLTVYSKNNCPACSQAKALLKKYEIPFDEAMIDNDSSAKEFVLSEGHRTVPQIYKGKDLFVAGGYLGLVKMSEEDIKAILYGSDNP